jgi:hypothetical protein
MTSLLSEVWTIDAIVALVVIEGLILAGRRLKTGLGPPVTGTLANLCSGAALLMALRATLAGGSFASVLVFLAVSLVAHVVDLGSRWETGLSHRSADVPSAPAADTV